MPPTGDSPDRARADSLAAWLREQQIPWWARGALLRDLRRVSDEPGDGQSRLRGLDRDGFAAELHTPDGGAVAAVRGVGAKTLAALRRAIPLPARRDGAGEESAAPPAAEPPEPAASDAGDALAELVAAADGLLVPSESEHPFTSFRWEGPGPLTPEALPAQLGLPAGTPVETRSLESFFAPLRQAAEWMDDGERARAARFAALRDRIAALLSNPVVYRVGENKIAVVIAGQDAAGRSVGLRTTVIET